MADRKPPAMKIVIDGKEREITFEELTLSNNLAQEALVRLLIDKKIIDPKEYVGYMERVREERYHIPGQDDQKAPSDS